MGSYNAVCENCGGTVNVRYNVLLGTKRGRCMDCGAMYRASQVRLLREKARFTLPKTKTLQSASLRTPVSVDSSDANASWFLQKGADTAGPATLDEMVHLIKGHELHAGDFVWRQGMQQWVRIEQTPEFSPYFTADLVERNTSRSDTAHGPHTGASALTSAKVSTKWIVMGIILCLLILLGVVVKITTAMQQMAGWSHKAITNEQAASNFVGGFNDDDSRMYHMGLAHIRNQHERIGAFTIGDVGRSGASADCATTASELVPTSCERGEAPD